jgi:hypothetical protein
MEGADNIMPLSYGGENGLKRKQTFSSGEVSRAQRAFVSWIVCAISALSALHPQTG